MKKIAKILLIFMILLMFLITISYGFGLNDLKGNEAGTSDLAKAGNSLVSVITSVGVVISVITLAILGVKYMLGSVEERAEYKKTLMPYFIGATLVFSASTIAEIIYRFVK